MKHRIPLGIKSCFKNHFRQEAVCNTWLKTIDTNKFMPIFLVGKPNESPSLINDILYLDCEDSYSLLYTKTIAYFNWAYNNTDASHFWIVDDDSYINCKKFNDYNHYLNYDYSGSFIYGIEKTNDNNGFASGSGYCLSRKAVDNLSNIDNFLLEIKKNNQKFSDSAEDLFVGNILNKYMPNIKKLHINNIYPWSYCKYYPDLMIGHYVHINSGLPFEDSMKKMHGYYYDT